MNVLLFKTRIKNKYTICTFFVVFVFGLVSWLMGSEIIPVLWGYGPDVACSYKEYVLLMWDQLLCWEIYMDSLMRYIVHVFPIILGFCVSGFVDEVNTFYVVGANRIGNRRKSLAKSMAVYSITGGLVTVVPLIILTIAVDYLMYPSLSGLGGIGTIFSENFYSEHPLTVFITMMLILYIPLACAYALLSLAVGLITRDKIKMILIPEAIYIIMNYINMLTKGGSRTSAADIIISYNTSSTFGKLIIELLVNIILALICAVIALQIDKHKRVII